MQIILHTAIMKRRCNTHCQRRYFSAVETVHFAEIELKIKKHVFFCHFLYYNVVIFNVRVKEMGCRIGIYRGEKPA